MADINIGQLSEAINDKADRDLNNTTRPYVVEQYDDGNGNGWEKWSDGKLVQHQTASGTFNSNTVFNLLTPFYSDNYFIIGTANSENATLSSSASCMWSCKTKTTETFTGEACRGTTGNKTFFFLTWLAIGRWK